jgi:hypothetical protein
MATAKVLFYYERTRKQQAKVLGLNMLLLPMVMWLWLLLLPATDDLYQQFFDYALYIVVVGELGLITVALWFITHPATFYIKLTQTEFCSAHPTMKDWSFSVNPQDITEIAHSTDRDASASYISVWMKDGSSFLLSPNFSYNRQQLYAALRLVNPNLKLPKQHRVFSDQKSGLE